MQVRKRRKSQGASELAFVLQLLSPLNVQESGLHWLLQEAGGSQI